MKKVSLFFVLVTIVLFTYATDFPVDHKSVTPVDSPFSPTHQSRISRDVPDWEWAIEPVGLLSSYYDYFQTYTGIPMASQPEEHGGGLYLTYRTAETAAATHQLSYSYVDANGNVTTSAGLGCEGRYGDCDVDPETGDGFVAYHQSSSNVIFLYDLYHLVGLPGLWLEPAYTVMDMAELQANGTYPYDDDAFVWPKVHIGPSPLPNHRRIYIFSTNSTESHGVEALPSDNVLIAYADFATSDLETQSSLEWSYRTVEQMDDWNAEDPEWARPLVSMEVHDNVVIMMGYLAHSDLNGYQEDELLVLINENYGEGPFEMYTEGASFEQENPSYYDPESGSFYYLFSDSATPGIPYVCSQDIMHSGHFNLVWNENYSTISFAGSMGISFDVGTEPGSYYPGWNQIYPKRWTFDLTSHSFGFQDIYPKGANPNDNIPMQPWDLNEDGVFDEVYDTGMPVWVEEWPIYYHDPAAAFHMNQTFTVTNEETGWQAMLWLDGTNQKNASEGFEGYEGWEGYHEIAVVVSSDFGQNWSDPFFINAKTDDVNYSDAIDGMIPVYMYPGDEIDVIDYDNAIGRMHLLFYDDNDFGSFVQANAGLANGGTYQYAAIDIHFEKNIAIEVSDAQCQVNGNATIDVITSAISQNDNVISYQFVINYDPAIVQFDDYEMVGTLSVGGSVTYNDNNGVLSIAYMTSNVLAGEGTLLSLNFEGLTEGISDIVISDFFYNTQQVDDLTYGSIEVIPQQGPDWSVNPADYEYNGSIWGIVLLHDVEVEITTGMLGCFVGEECRGVSSLENGSIIDYTLPFGHIIFLPMVYSNATSGETLHFQYYDAETEEIYPILESIDFVADMVVGDGFDPFVLHAGVLEISKAMVSGWNWLSLNVEADDMSTNTVLASIGDNGSNIKNQTESAIYYSDLESWYGTLINFDNYTFYKMSIENPVTFEFSGMPVDINETIYNLNSGWNWISYSPQEAEEINYALNSITEGSNIKNQVESALYYEGMGWFGTMANLEPLGGYMLQMNAPEQLIYPEPVPLVRDCNNITKFVVESPEWSVNPHEYELNGVINALIIGESEIDPSDYELAVFCVDECRGIAEVLDYTQSFNGVFHSMMVYSNELSGDELQLVVYDKNSGEVIETGTHFTFTEDMVIGDFIDPVQIMLPGNETDVIPASRLVSCYPNPFNPETNISFELAGDEFVLIEVYNIKGQKVDTVLEQEMSSGAHSVTWNAEGHNSGIYFLRFEAEGQCDVKKVILLK